MQSKITFKNVLKIARGLITLAIFVVLLTGLAQAQVFVNGTLSTGATTVSGVAAPAGFTWSECQNPTGNTTVANTLAGAGAQIVNNNSVADDFTVPAGPSWNISKVTVYAYSTGYVGTTSPFTDVRVRIHNSSPLAGPTTIAFGDLTTNRFAASSNSNMYRIFNTVVAPATAPNTTRTIWKIEANVSVLLAPGTYWLEFRVGTALASNFVPLSAPVGVRTLPGYNAIQSLAGTWAALVDAGQGVPADVATAVPFSLDYTTGPCTGTPTPGNTISSATTAICAPTPATLSLQNLTLGSGVTYQWQSGTSAAGPFTNITGATGNTYIATPSATTFYRAAVTCGGNTGNSTPVQVVVNPVSACYCIPANSDCTDDDLIENVRLGNLNKTTTCSAPTGYSNYTATDTANIIQGGANPITVTTGDNFTEQVGVWIDYDRSGSFEASEFTNLGATAAGSGGAHIGAIAVPATAPLGYTRMRVRVRFATALTGANACLAYTFGETEDYTVNIIPCIPVTVTTQPVNRTVACETSTTFSAAFAGSLPVAYWEYRTSATGVWLNVPNTTPYSGVNTNTLTINNTPSNLNGYQYRAVYQGACAGVDFTSAGTLTVTPIVAGVTPASAAICLGSTQQLSITNIAAPSSATSTVTSGAISVAIPDNLVSGASHIIPVTLPAGAQITDMNVTLNMTHPWAGDVVFVLKAPNGAVFNLDYYLTGTGEGPSTGFTNTVISSTGTAALSTGSGTYTGTFRPDGAGSASVPAAGPTGFAPTVGTFAGLYSVPNGNWTLAMYDGGAGDVGTLTSWSLNFTYLAGAPATGTWTGPAGTIFTNAAATAAYTAGTPINTVYVKPTTAGVNNYTVTVATPNCTSAALTIPVTANSPATAIGAATTRAICANGSTTITAAITGGSGYSYQWKVAPSGSTTYTNVTNGGVYSGATTGTLTITNAPTSLTGSKYVLEIGFAPCTAAALTSAPGTLTVNARPVVTLTPSLPGIYPGQTSTITVAVSPNAAASYIWFKDGVVVPGATAGTLVADIDDLGSYTVQVTDVNGCVGTSAATVISSTANDILFIYPNPSNGQFQVRYFSELGSTIYPRLLSVYDMKGAKVFTKSYAINSPYTRMDVDMSNHGRGVYQVELTDNEGKRIKVGRVLVH